MNEEWEVLTVRADEVKPGDWLLDGAGSGRVRKVSDPRHKAFPYCVGIWTLTRTADNLVSTPRDTKKLVVRMISSD